MSTIVVFSIQAGARDKYFGFENVRLLLDYGVLITGEVLQCIGNTRT